MTAGNGKGSDRSWGINNDYARLHDVLLGKPEYFQWVEAGPLIGRTLANAEKTGFRFDLQTAMAQVDQRRLLPSGADRLSLP